MAHWIGTRAIIKKYEISKKELLYIIRKGEVACSDIDGILLVDEDSFIAYIDALKQVRQKDSVVHRLRQALRSGKSLSLNKREATLALRLENCLPTIYAITTHALSMLLDRRKRAIFLAFANGDSLSSVARQMRLRKEVVFSIFEEVMHGLDKQAPYIIQRLSQRCQAVEEMNQELVDKITECKKIVFDKECEVGKLKVRIEYLQLEEEHLKSHLEQVEALFKGEREMNAALEEALTTYEKDAVLEFFAAVKAGVERFFHLFKGWLFGFLGKNAKKR